MDDARVKEKKKNLIYQIIIGCRKQRTFLSIFYKTSFARIVFCSRMLWIIMKADIYDELISFYFLCVSSDIVHNVACTTQHGQHLMFCVGTGNNNNKKSERGRKCFDFLIPTADQLNSNIFF